METHKLIREDQLPNYPDNLAIGHELPEPLDFDHTIQRELEELRKENHKLKLELETKKLIGRDGDIQTIHIP